MVDSQLVGTKSTVFQCDKSEAQAHGTIIYMSLNPAAG